MNAPAIVIPITAEEAHRFGEFFAAESLADTGKRPLIDEMIAAVDYERDRLGRSIRLAYQLYAAPFDPVAMRRYVVLRYAIDILERMAEHKSEVAPILFPEMAPKWRRA